MAFDTGQVVTVAVVAGAAYLMLRRGGCCSVSPRDPAEHGADETSGSGAPGEPHASDPLRMLQVRLARGEIGEDEYERLRSRLTSSVNEAREGVAHGMLRR